MNVRPSKYYTLLKRVIQNVNTVQYWSSFSTIQLDKGTNSYYFQMNLTELDNDEQLASNINTKTSDDCTAGYQLK